MKKAILLSFVGLLAAGMLRAQAPQMFNYQGVARNATGEVLADQDISLLIRINIGSVAGPSVYTETHDVTTNGFGLFTLRIGTGAVQSGVFANIAWGDDSFFLEVHMDPAGGNDYSLLGTTQLLSVPYSLYSERSGNAYWQKTGDDIHFSSGKVGIGEGLPVNTLDVNGRAVIGSGYSGNYAAPADGLLVEGNIGVGTAIATSRVHAVGTAATGKLATPDYGAYGSHSSTNNVGYLGGSNAGGYGFSAASKGLQGYTFDGVAVYGSVDGTGYSGFFVGRSYFAGNVGIGEANPNRALYVSELQAGLSFPLKLENKFSTVNEAAVGILFSTGGSGTNDRGKGGLVYQYTSTWNRGSFHFLQNTAANSGNPTLTDAVMTITNDGKVGIGTTSPSARLHAVGTAAYGQLATSNYGAYGSHVTSGAYGYLGGSNVGGFGHSAASYGLWGSTQNGTAVYATVSGAGWAGYFEGKSYFSGPVGIGTIGPSGTLEVWSNDENLLVLTDSDGGGTRPGIKFRNNSTQYISGDDLSDENFNFYSIFSSTRNYDAKLAVYGKTSGSWGKYIGIKHDGSDGYIDTDAGDIYLQPAGGDVVIQGNLKTTQKTGYLFVPPSSFNPRQSGYAYTNYGTDLYSAQNNSRFVATVNLPHNAVIVSMTAWLTDGSTSDATLNLMNRPPTGTWTTMATVTSYGSISTLLTLTDNTITDATVDNVNKFYYMDLTLQNVIDFLGARIEYTYTGY